MAAKPEPAEKSLGFWIVILGLGVMVMTLAIAALRWVAAPDVTMVVSGMGSIVGSLVGAFFGVQIGAAGKSEADKNAANANAKLAWMAMGITDEHVRNDYRQQLGRLVGP